MAPPSLLHRACIVACSLFLSTRFLLLLLLLHSLPPPLLPFLDEEDYNTLSLRYTFSFLAGLGALAMVASFHFLDNHLHHHHPYSVVKVGGEEVEEESYTEERLLSGEGVRLERSCNREFRSWNEPNFGQKENIRVLEASAESVEKEDYKEDEQNGTFEAGAESDVELRDVVNSDKQDDLQRMPEERKVAVDEASASLDGFREISSFSSSSSSSSSVRITDQICIRSTCDGLTNTVELVSAMAKSKNRSIKKKVSFAVDVMVNQIDNNDDDHQHNHGTNERVSLEIPYRLPYLAQVSNGRVATEQDLQYAHDYGTVSEVTSQYTNHKGNDVYNNLDNERNCMCNDLNHEKNGRFNDLNHERNGIYKVLNHGKIGGYIEAENHEKNDLQSQADAFISRFKQNLSIQNRNQNQNRKQKNQQHYRGFRLTPN